MLITFNCLSFWGLTRKALTHVNMIMKSPQANRFLNIKYKIRLLVETRLTMAVNHEPVILCTFY